MTVEQGHPSEKTTCDGSVAILKVLIVHAPLALLLFPGCRLGLCSGVAGGFAGGFVTWSRVAPTMQYRTR